MFRERFHPRRGIDQVSYKAVVQPLRRSLVAYERTSVVERNAVTEQWFHLGIQFRTQLFHPGDETLRGSKCAIGRVRLRVGSAPVAHELVAEEMLHAAIFRKNGFRLSFEDVVKELKHSIGPD